MTDRDRVIAELRDEFLALLRQNLGYVSEGKAMFALVERAFDAGWARGSAEGYVDGIATGEAQGAREERAGSAAICDALAAEAAEGNRKIEERGEPPHPTLCRVVDEHHRAAERIRERGAHRPGPAGTEEGEP